VIEYVPRGVTVPQFDVLIERTVDDPVVELGLNKAVAPLGSPITLNAMESGKLTRATLIV
jgi:hypothetical protein